MNGFPSCSFLNRGESLNGPFVHIVALAVQEPFAPVPLEAKAVFEWLSCCSCRRFFSVERPDLELRYGEVLPLEKKKAISIFFTFISCENEVDNNNKNYRRERVVPVGRASVGAATVQVAVDLLRENKNRQS